MVDNTATMEGTITALDGTNVRHKEVTTATRIKPAVVEGPLTTATEMGNHDYILHYLLGEVCPVVEAILPLVNWIEPNGTEWVCIMAEQETMTQLAYNVS